MKKFNIGDRVITVVNGEILKGTIQSLYTDLFNPQAIVKFDDGTTGKCSLNTIALEPVTETQTEEQTEKKTKKTSEVVPDDKEITITYGEFKTKSTDTIIELTGIDFSRAMVLIEAFGKLACELFVPEAEE